MDSHPNEPDDPLTPAGRLFLHPEMNVIIHCVFGFKNPIDVAQAKSTIRDSLMVQHPRFSSLMVRDSRGFEHWRKTHIDIDRHVIVVSQDHNIVSVNDYVAELSVSSPLSYDKPLWEIHVLEGHNCAVFRIHHALGDGISLMSMLLASCRLAADTEALPTVGVAGNRRDNSLGRNWREIVGGFVKMIWFSLMFCIEFVLTSLWVCDRKTAISGGAGVELWPRKLATATFVLEDMKAVKRAFDNATINDVLFGVVSFGLSRYLDHRSPNALPEGLRITGVAMINLRQQPGLQAQELSEMMKRKKSGSRWGNKFGILLLPVYYHKAGPDPLAYLRRAKAMIDRKKRTLEGHFSYRIGYLVMSWFGSKFASMLNYRIVCNTSFTISNLVGPQEEITLAGNPVTYIRANTSSIAHALTMHVVSYAGRADMQILVAKDIIPDPEFLAKCFEDALLEMKEAATAAEVSNKI
ncbi:wax ester synthase/diacylglycerol acyltransferase 11-like isoform X2 [Mangifera indica]|uniref:wax ester synthase/diacylglycerol acyltransferase 11-like isoform X2 n=1 Tax=Mangifera indica TaxID=29780 RepID=UPI001CFC03E8|nr:wax ester synthase/diacylglycerol acyltransferase 11-like isoform X2 [Mangifera indica]